MNKYQIAYFRRQIVRNETLQAIGAVVMFTIGMVILGAICLFN